MDYKPGFLKSGKLGNSSNWKTGKREKKDGLHFRRINIQKAEYYLHVTMEQRELEMLVWGPSHTQVSA